MAAAAPGTAGWYIGERALVVGASGGIGRAIAEELLDHGADAALTFHSHPKVTERLVARGAALDRRCFAYRIDLRDPAAIAGTCERLIEDLGVPTIVVFGAGLLRDQPLGKTSTDDWHLLLDTNLSGIFELLRRLAPPMMRQGRGRIVAVASVSGIHGQPGQAAYAASKGGLIAMSRALARELGPFGITVNVLAPGFVDTDMTRGMAEGLRRRSLGRIPLRRFATPADLVPAARLLMIPEGGYITGQVLVVDGGLTC